MNDKNDKKVVAGVDVSSQELVVRISCDTKVLRYANDSKGIRELIRVLNKLRVTLVVCEHTGRHEEVFLRALWNNNIPVHCAQPKAVHNFGKAMKANGKSDPLDAGTIMEYGLRMDLTLTSAPPAEITALKELTRRREDLNGILVQEKNRLQAPAISTSTKASVKALIRYLTKALNKNAEEIAQLVKNTPSLRAPIECLDDEHGVGAISAASIYASMPELGTLTRQTAACLAGLAPLTRDSGKFSGQRKISGGRTQTRNALYMVALSVIRKKDHVLRTLYIRLKAAGKKSNVALTAVMRKLIIRFNSKLRELRTLQTQISPEST